MRTCFRPAHSNNYFFIISLSDLSSTSLVQLPSTGLETVEVLHILNTHTLKTIPSIYNFQVSNIININVFVLIYILIQ